MIFSRSLFTIIFRPKMVFSATDFEGKKVYELVMFYRNKSSIVRDKTKKKKRENSARHLILLTGNYCVSSESLLGLCPNII